MRGYDLSGRVVLSAPDADSADERLVAAAMDPFTERAAPPDVPHVILRLSDPVELDEIHRPAGDGLVTASHDGGVRLVAGGPSCSVPDALAGEPVTFEYERGFPLGAAIKPFVRTALQLSALK